jgi:acetyl-CoA synthetase
VTLVVEARTAPPATAWPRIVKRPDRLRVPPNLDDYDRVRACFSWEDMGRRLCRPPWEDGLNIAHEAVDRHAAGERRDRVALRCLGRTGRVRELTFGELAAASNRFANTLAMLGIRPGERVFLLLDRTPELYVAALGAWKARAVVCPLFPAFGPDPIRQRLVLGRGKVLVTTRGLYDRKVAALLAAARGALPDLEQVVLVGGAAGAPGTRDFHELLDADEDHQIAPTHLEDPAILHFTSGTTGTPKGALHVHGAVLAHYATGLYVLDLHPEDVFWCTADPGWVTGTSYGVIAPLVHGVTSVVDDGDFDAERWYGILQDQRVTVWYTTPTAIRMLMRVGAETAGRFDLSRLRYAASVGEALNPEAVVWGEEVLGLPIHDNWWQTETGAIMIANFPAMDVKPGSMGRPVPGVEAAIVRRTAEGGVERIDEPGATGEIGEIALEPSWPSMFRGYVGEEERYRACFAGGWYLSGDLARRDEEGYFWFVGRIDDVIKSAGHLIGPFEVESALLEHPAVAEAAVIGKPDPVVGEVVKAFVALKPAYEPGEGLRRELLAHARRRLGAAVAPKEIELVPHLPRTRSGKLMRRLLKARELGLPEGDLSTLEPPP